MVGKDTVIINHRYVSADQHLSPHHDERPDDEICLIVIHCISLPEAHFGSRYIDDLFMGRHHDGAHPELDELSDLKVSAHIVIDREGRVTQYVPFDRRAWHAGESVYAGRTRCNDFSIGIELVGTDHHAYSEAQYRALVPLVSDLQSHYAIPGDAIVGHSDIAPERKTDPGNHFDWSRIRTNGA